MSNLICSLYFLLLLIQCDLVTSKLKAGLTLIQVVDEVRLRERLRKVVKEDGKGRGDDMIGRNMICDEIKEDVLTLDELR